MRKFACLGVICSVLIILGLFLPQWHIAIGSPEVETIRPTNHYDAAGLTTNETQAYDGNTATSGDTEFGGARIDDPSINYGQDGNNNDTWENKAQSWDSATLYATVERENATDDTAGVYIINSTGIEKHTLLEMGSLVFSKQEVSQTLNSSDWGGSGFPDIYDLRVKVKTTKSKGSDGKLLKIYDIRIEGSYTPAYISFTVTDYNGDGVKFGSLSPGSVDQPADQNATVGAVTLTVGNETNVDVGIYLKGTNFTKGGDTIPITNVKYNDDNTTAGASSMSAEYVWWYTVPAFTENVTQCYHWISIPSGQAPGDYSSTFYYKAQQT